MQSTPFGKLVRDYLRVVGYSQQNLAAALALHPVVLSRKLHGTANAYLTQQEIKRIIALLAEWRALSTRAEVLYLLEQANLPARSLSDEEWNSAPLSELDRGASPAAPPHSAPTPSAAPSPGAWPSPMTRLIGRQWEIRRLTQLLSSDGVRLVTLVGPGGSGKTRLALEIAAHLRYMFTHGIYWVALAGVRSPDLVPNNLLQTLGLRSTPGMSAQHTLIQFLRDRQLLLVLDNFEQLSPAASVVVELLEAVPGLSVLVTSREPLHLYGEYEFRVPPLALPDPGAVLDVAGLNQYAAVQLFLERAQAAQPMFSYTPDMGRSIAQICISLDGLPLALELAAARIKLLSPAALLHQLQTSRLAVLTWGVRNLHPRQQTLRNTLQWSYDLLDGPEQQLFRRLAVFVNSFSLEAAEQVGGPVGAARDKTSGGARQAMLERLTSLVDKSMLQCLEQKGDETLPRFRMLETLREFGLEQLAARQEDTATWQAYTGYYMALVKEAETHLRDASQQVWVGHLTQEYENVLNALQWLLAAGQGETALRLSSAIREFWWIRGLIDEGLTFLEQALAAPGNPSKAVRARGLAAAGFLAIHLEDLRHTEELLTECVSLFRELEDSLALSDALRVLGQAVWSRGDYPQAQAILTEALQLSREREDAQGIAETLMLLPLLNVACGDCALALTQAEEGVALFLQSGDDMSYTISRVVLGWVAAFGQDLGKARLLLEEAVAHSRERNYLYNLAHGLPLLGLIGLWQGETATAEALFKECLQLPEQHFYRSFMALSLGGLGAMALCRGDLARTYSLLEQCREMDGELGKPSNLAAFILGLASGVAAQGELKRAARLLGTLETMCEGTQAVVPMTCESTRIFTRAKLRRVLGEEASAAAAAEGRLMTLEQVLEM